MRMSAAFSRICSATPSVLTGMSLHAATRAVSAIWTASNWSYQSDNSVASGCVRFLRCWQNPNVTQLKAPSASQNGGMASIDGGFCLSFFISFIEIAYS